jgi:hypothetical protein
MTTLALTQFIHRTPGLLQKIGDAIASFFEGIDHARRLARRFDALARLSDAELARRGLKRSEIASFVLANDRA